MPVTGKVAIGAGGATLDGVVVSGGGEIDVGSTTVTGVTSTGRRQPPSCGMIADSRYALGHCGSSEDREDHGHGAQHHVGSAQTLTLANVTLDGVTLSGNVTDVGTLTIDDTVKLDGATINGGTIYDADTLLVTGSTRSKNATVNGGTSRLAAARR